jgi:hypothetical protein
MSAHAQALAAYEAELLKFRAFMSCLAMLRRLA